MEIKVIDFLNSIVKDKKLPSQVDYCGMIFEYDKGYMRYRRYNFEDQIFETLNEYIDLERDLNDTIYISGFSINNPFYTGGE